MPGVKDTDPDFPSLISAIPLASVDRDARGVHEKPVEVSRPDVPIRIKLGPGKFFRPTKGLCALFHRTGTRRHPRPPQMQPPPTIPHLFRYYTFKQEVLTCFSF